MPAAPQAWVPAKGEVDVAFSYQNSYTADHLFSHGESADKGHISIQGTLMDATFGVTDRLAVKVALPFLAGKYSGAFPHQLPIDDGTYHASFQDFSTEVRYNVSKYPVVVTPFFTAIVPSHNYEYFAHSAIGRDLREFRLGVNLGRRLDPLIRRGFAQAKVSYNFVEKVLNISHDSMSAEMEVGYFLSRRLALIALGTGLNSFGGINLNLQTYPQDLIRISPALYVHHDQLARARFIDVGGGAAYQVNPRFAIFGAAVTTVWGANVHAVVSGVTVGLNWTFQTRGEDVRYARSQLVGGADGFVQARCVCPKK